MDPWTGRYLAQARIDALVREAADERLAAGVRDAARQGGFVAGHVPNRRPLAREGRIDQTTRAASWNDPAVPIRRCSRSVGDPPPVSGDPPGSPAGTVGAGTASAATNHVAA